MIKKIIIFLFVLSIAPQVSAETTIYNLSLQQPSLSTWARWSEYYRINYIAEPLGTGRGGYYVKDTDYNGLGYCSSSLCEGYGRIASEIFNFYINNKSVEDVCNISIHTFTPTYKDWFNPVLMKVYINGLYIGEFLTAERGEEKTSFLDFNCSLLNNSNNIWIFPSVNYGQSRLSRMNWLAISYNTITPINISSRPLIITNTPFFSNSIPTLFQYNQTSSQYIQDYINRYSSDHIYTIGFSSSLPNSTQISLNYAPEFFFPNATQAVFYGNNETKGILTSQIAAHLGIPLIFTSGNYSEIFNFSQNSTKEIQDFYLQKIIEKGDNIDCITLVNPEHESSLLAGRYSGRNGCYIVPLYYMDYDNIRSRIRETRDMLSERGLFSGSSGYRMGKPLYIVIFGGNESVPFSVFGDMGFEVFFDKDGSYLYNDMNYGLLDNGTFSHFAIGRFPGNNEDISLQLDSRFIDKTNNSVIFSEYGIGSRLDFMAYGGGMLQGFVSGHYLEEGGLPVMRVVEQRTDNITSIDDIRELINKIKKYSSKIGSKGIDKLAGPVGFIMAVLELGDMFMYPLYEFDWMDFVNNITLLDYEEPRHLPVLNETNVGLIDNQKISAYFGAGDEYWILPNHEMDYWSMLLWPYENPNKETIYVKDLNYSGFLYNDHDNSYKSTITHDMIRSGGSLVVSSGISHVFSNVYPSNAFFRSISNGASAGEGLLNAFNLNPESVIIKHLSMLTDIHASLGVGRYIKSKMERILFGDPKQKFVYGREYLIERPEYFITPFYSFLSVQNISGIYEITDGNVFFNNSDTHLLVAEMPIIPLYERDFYLPKGSVINYVNFSASYSSYAGINRNILYNDSYYTNHTKIITNCADSLGLVVGESLTEEEKDLLENCIKDSLEPVVEYPYPDMEYWTENHTLLDGRILFRVYVPAIIHMNESYSDVLENATLYVDYDTPVEMSVSADDITVFDDAITNIIIYNHGDNEISGNLSLILGDELRDIEITMPQYSESTETVNFGPLDAGSYEIVSAFSSDDISIGPRYSQFNVFGEPFFNSSYNDTITVNEGESGFFNISLIGLVDIDFSGISFESTDLVSNPIIDNENINLDVIGLNAKEWTIIAIINIPDMQSLGAYKGQISVKKDGNNVYSMPITVVVPQRAVPEVEPALWNLKGVPKYKETKNFTIRNTGNVPIDNVIAESVILGALNPDESTVYGIEKEIPYLPPGLYNDTIIFGFDCEFCTVEEITIPITIEVEPVVYWEMTEPWELVYETGPLERVFAVNNSNESNVDINELLISVFGITGLESNSFLEDPIAPDFSDDLLISLTVPDEIERGIHEGYLSVYGEDYFVPENHIIPLTLITEGPEFSVEKSYSPKKIFNLWNKFIIPRKIHTTINIRNDGKHEIKSIRFNESIPEGWSIDGIVSVYLGREFRRNPVPFRLLYKERISSDDNVEITINDISSILRRNLRKNEYIIIKYPLKAERFVIPETESELNLHIKTVDNVYDEFSENYEIPVKSIRNIFGFF